MCASTALNESKSYKTHSQYRNEPMKCYVFSMCVRLNNGFLLCCFVCFSFIITCDPVPLWLVRAATKFDFTYLLTFIDNETYDDQHNDGKSIPNRFWMCGFSHSDRMRMYDFFSTNFMFFFFWQNQSAQLLLCVSVRLDCRFDTEMHSKTSLFFCGRRCKGTRFGFVFSS